MRNTARTEMLTHLNRHYVPCGFLALLVVSIPKPQGFTAQILVNYYDLALFLALLKIKPQGDF